MILGFSWSEGHLMDDQVFYTHTRTYTHIEIWGILDVNVERRLRTHVSTYVCVMKSLTRGDKRVVVLRFRDSKPLQVKRLKTFRSLP